MTKKLTKLTIFQKLARSIKRGNERFKRASPSQRRVIVATDVLKLLDARKLRVVTGYTYCELPEAARAQLGGGGAGAGIQLSELIPQLPPCTVCGIGAAMVATILIRNRVTVGDEGLDRDHYWPNSHFRISHSGGPVDKMTADVFTDDLLGHIESAFEHTSFGYDHANPTTRLRAIYQNIIDNRGKRFTCHDKERGLNGAIVWKAGVGK